MAVHGDGVHVVNMIVPQVFRPVAVVWLGLSEKLGAMSSKVLLSIVYFCVVTPIGLLRRLAGKDSLKLRVFKASQESAMWERNHSSPAEIWNVLTNAEELGYAILEGFVGFHGATEEILVAAHHHYSSRFWHPDRVRRNRDRSLHLHR